MKKKKAPVLGPAETNGNLLTNAACPTECTGLIQILPQNEDELENYNEVYSFTKEVHDA